MAPKFTERDLALLRALEGYRAPRQVENIVREGVPAPILQKKAVRETFEEVKTSLENFNNAIADAIQKERQRLERKQLAGIPREVAPPRGWTSQRETKDGGDIDFRLVLNVDTVEDLFNDYRELFEKTLRDILLTKGAFRFSIRCPVSNWEYGNRVAVIERLNGADLITVRTARDIQGALRQCQDQLNTQVDIIHRRPTGAVLQNIAEVVLQVSLTSFVATGYVPLPKTLSKKRCCFNPEILNRNDCVRLAITHAVFNRQNPNLNWHAYETYQRFFPLLDWSKVSVPMDISQIPAFEIDNDIRINRVYYWDEDEPDRDKRISLLYESVYEPRNTQPIDRTNLIALLLIDNPNDENGHMVSFPDAEKSVGSFLSKSGANYRVMCVRCNSFFKDKEAREEHSCLTGGIPQEILMPKNPRLAFSNKSYAVEAPMVVCADFESMLVPLKSEQGEHSEFEHVINHHQLYGYSLVLVCREEPSLNERRTYKNPVPLLVIRDMLETLRRWLKILLDRLQKFKDYKKMIITPEEEAEFERATHCCICQKVFTARNPKVKHHSHFTNRYCGPAHRDCNLPHRELNKLVVFFHNFKGYDNHFLLQHLDELGSYKYFGTHNQITSLTLKEGIVFKDSLGLINGSLGSIVSSMSASELRQTAQHFENDADKLALLTRKGAYPYDYFTCYERFAETSLPPRSFFKSDEDYEHALKVWDVFKCKTTGDFADIYNLTDTLFLADALESRRDLMLREFGIDPVHCFSSSGLGYEGLKKKQTNAPYFLQNKEIYLEFQTKQRGGMSGPSRRYAKANNPYLADYNPNEKTTYLIELDARNLFGAQMMKDLPHRYVGTVSKPEKIAMFDINDDWENENVFIFLVADIHLPAEFHDHVSDFPFCPEKEQVSFEELSPLNAGRVNSNQLLTPQLLATLKDKKEYLIALPVAKLAMKHGYQLTKIHRIIVFLKEPWMKKFVSLCSEKRREAKRNNNQFMTDFYKEMVNANYGKLLENLLKYTQTANARCAKTRKQYRNHPGLLSRQILTDEKVLYEFRSKKVCLDRFPHVGFAVQELAKLRMYSFFYEVIKPTFGDRVRLCYHDTDSFLLYVQTEDFYGELEKFKDEFDLSSLPKDRDFIPFEGANVSQLPANHNHYDDTNFMIPGKMADNRKGAVIREFIGLRSKGYLVITEQGNTSKIAGMTPSNLFDRDQWMNCLTSDAKVSGENIVFRADKDHQVRTVAQPKTALSGVDVKRYVINGGLDSRPYGHYKNE